ncbi:hypothetical protein [Allorhodopirellula heiligendammensis]|uniref:Uncharacterized protein n=1 Tax=Allorhodopirellula heiligendammensis TaxID=2714739 RepID=A0A5C6CAX2_9BACT|nr:hypothetical protein [Allorhodopirellula heiligendammensis]TWU19959.1 hypothetical protein Poly21_21380 [Allorhodopirellula heiligendammensis]
MIGLPFLAPSPEKMGRFPCENCSCGCATADFCWDKCCCHSDIEKLQWAADHNVTPPAFLVARVSSTHGRESLAKLNAKTTDASCCCCRGPNADSCTIAVVTDHTSAESSSPTQTGPSVRLVSLEDAAKCRGISWLWSIFSEVIVAPADRPISDPEPRLLFCLVIANEHASSGGCRPDPPIP